MNSKILFKQAVKKANALPDLIATPELKRIVMLAEVAQWIYDAEPFIDGRNISDSLVRTTAETIDLINKSLS
jgi:hypothetical protein